jgi:hypothetical protein
MKFNTTLEGDNASAEKGMEMISPKIIRTERRD